MTSELQAAVTAALPHEAAVLRTLSDLPDTHWHEAARGIVTRLPEFDLVLTPAGTGEAFADALASNTGATLATARRSTITAAHHRGDQWSIEQAPLVGKRRALIATALLTDGLPEMELATIARTAGLEVIGTVAAIELTSRGARTRLDMLGVHVSALMQLAHTPDGLKIEQRGVNGEILVPMQ